MAWQHGCGAAAGGGGTHTNPPEGRSPHTSLAAWRNCSQRQQHGGQQACVQAASHTRACLHRVTALQRRGSQCLLQQRPLQCKTQTQHPIHTHCADRCTSRGALGSQPGALPLLHNAAASDGAAPLPPLHVHSQPIIHNTGRQPHHGARNTPSGVASARAPGTKTTYAGSRGPMGDAQHGLRVLSCTSRGAELGPLAAYA